MTRYCMRCTKQQIITPMNIKCVRSLWNHRDFLWVHLRTNTNKYVCNFVRSFLVTWCTYYFPIWLINVSSSLTQRRISCRNTKYLSVLLRDQENSERSSSFVFNNCTPGRKELCEKLFLVLQFLCCNEGRVDNRLFFVYSVILYNINIYK